MFAIQNPSLICIFISEIFKANDQHRFFNYKLTFFSASCQFTEVIAVDEMILVVGIKSFLCTNMIKVFVTKENQRVLNMYNCFNLADFYTIRSKLHNNVDPSFLPFLMTGTANKS